MYTVKKCGMWKTVKQPKRYIDQLYVASPFTQCMFDHLLPVTGGMYKDIDPEWVQTDSDDDDADNTVPTDIEELMSTVNL